MAANAAASTAPKAGMKAEANAAPAAADGAEGAPKKSNRKLLMIGGIVLAALMLAGTGAYFAFGGKGHAEDAPKAGSDGKAAAKAEAKADAHGAVKKMLYVPMDMFTVNMRAPDSEHFLQTTISLEVADAATMEAIKQQMPAIRNRVLLLLSSKGVEELSSREGKEKLAAEICAEARKSVDGPGEKKGIEQVLFSHFVIQ